MGSHAGHPWEAEAINIREQRRMLPAEVRKHPNQQTLTHAVIPSLTTLTVSRAILATPILSAREKGFDVPFPSALGVAVAFSRRRPRLVFFLNRAVDARSHHPSLRYLLPRLRLRTPHLFGEAGCLLNQSAEPSGHGMTQACLHTALHSCAYVQSSRNIRYNLIASFLATATLARARCLRTARRR